MTVSKNDSFKNDKVQNEAIKNDQNERKNRLVVHEQGHSTSQPADVHFTEPQQAWLKKNWNYSANFMMSYGLMPYDDEDCEEAKNIVAAFMADEEENKKA